MDFPPPWVPPLRQPGIPWGSGVAPDAVARLTAAGAVGFVAECVRRLQPAVLPWWPLIGPLLDAAEAFEAYPDAAFAYRETLARLTSRIDLARQVLAVPDPPPRMGWWGGFAAAALAALRHLARIALEARDTPGYLRIIHIQTAFAASAASDARRGWSRSAHAEQDALFAACVNRRFDPAPYATEAVRSLATAIYAEKAFDRYPILADALEEAGLADDQALAELRGGSRAVAHRGYWLLADLTPQPRLPPAPWPTAESLAAGYHADVDQFDAVVCTGRHGDEPMPATDPERTAVTTNARQARDHARKLADDACVSREELADEIYQQARRSERKWP